MSLKTQIDAALARVGQEVKSLRQLVNTTMVAGGTAAGQVPVWNGSGWFPEMPQPLGAEAVQPRPEPGRFLVMPGGATGGTQILLATSKPIGEWIPIYEETAVDQIGINVSTAGAAGTTVGFAIYKKRPTSSLLDLIFSTAGVAANTTGFKEVSIAQTLSPGRYLMCVAERSGTAGTQPTVRVIQGLSPFEALAQHASLDPTRGGVPGLAMGNPSVNAGWPATLTLSDPGTTVSYTPAIYLRTA